LDYSPYIGDTTTTTPTTPPPPTTTTATMPGQGESHMARSGILVEKFELNP